MTIALPRLPYAAGALAPALSAEAVRYHHAHHHAGYVKAVNRLVRGRELDGTSLERIIARATGPLANAAAQAWNHAFYWHSMAPAGGRPDAALLRAIDESFGSRVAMARRFTKECLELFGSGWVWLVVTPAGSLDIVATPNAGLRLHEEPLHPLLVCDVWEHAYYLDYRGDRAAYVDRFWSVANWTGAGQRFDAFRAERRRRTRSGGRRAKRQAGRVAGGRRAGHQLS